MRGPGIFQQICEMRVQGINDALRPRIARGLLLQGLRIHGRMDVNRKPAESREPSLAWPGGIGAFDHHRHHRHGIVLQQQAEAGSEGLEAAVRRTLSFREPDQRLVTFQHRSA